MQILDDEGRLIDDTHSITREELKKQYETYVETYCGDWLSAELRWIWKMAAIHCLEELEKDGVEVPTEMKTSLIEGDFIPDSDLVIDFSKNVVRKAVKLEPFFKDKLDRKEVETLISVLERFSSPGNLKNAQLGAEHYSSNNDVKLVYRNGERDHFSPLQGEFWQLPDDTLVYFYTQKGYEKLMKSGEVDEETGKKLIVSYNLNDILLAFIKSKEANFSPD